MRYIWNALAFVLLMLVIVICTPKSHGLPGDDHGNHGDLKGWFDQLASKKGLCCSFADGVAIKDVDWDTALGADGKSHYRVRLPSSGTGNGSDWIVVPDAAVITEPNRYGPAVVWPYRSAEDPGTQIRCFMPGAGA